MVSISFVAFDGTRQDIEAEEGVSLMQAALAHDVDGILADCGGAMACATCHVHVDEAWVSEVGAASAAERELLELAIAPDERSRLSCQITVTARLDGIVLHLPEAQY